MAISLYGDITPRTAAYAARELLQRALPYLVFDKFGQSKELPERSTKVMKFRRYEALDNTPVALTEGVTPSASALVSTDYTVTLNEYGGLITVSDVIQDTHEDPVLLESMEMLGEQAAQMIERVRSGVLLAGSNVFYSNGTATNAVNTPLTQTVQRRATRSLKRQNARPITKIIRSTPDWGTQNVRPSYVSICHPDLENDIRNLTNFQPTELYGTESPWENELGKNDDVRYITTTLLPATADAGGAKGAMISTSGTSADVYPIITLGRDAYACVPLKGRNRLTPMVVNARPTDSDPLAQRAHASWKAYENCVILNDFWMSVTFVAATA